MPAVNGWLLIFALLAPVQAAPTPSPLNELCPIEYRNVPLKEAIQELSGRLRVPVLMDTSVPPETAAMPVRLYTRHLTGEQVLRWLARWAGLEAALVDGSMIIGGPEHLPRIWRQDRPPNTSTQPASSAAWLAVRGQSADIEWIDVPLSLVSREASSRFGTDVIIHPSILLGDHLVHIQQTGITLEQLCISLTTQLDAEADFLDGALWIYPRRGASSSTQPTARSALARPPGAPQPSLEVILAHEVMIDRPLPDWSAFARLVTAGTRVDCRVQAPSGAHPPDWHARGTAREILEAGKLLGLLDYHLEPSGTGTMPILLIRVHGIGR